MKDEQKQDGHWHDRLLMREKKLKKKDKSFEWHKSMNQMKLIRN